MKAIRLAVVATTGWAADIRLSLLASPCTSEAIARTAAFYSPAAWFKDPPYKLQILRPWGRELLSNTYAVAKHLGAWALRASHLDCAEYRNQALGLVVEGLSSLQPCPSMSILCL